MPAYLIAQVDVKDADRYARYRELVPATIEKFGGRYLARGGRVDALEGTAHLGVQNAQGDAMVSFLANEEVFEERPIGGRPFGTEGLHDAGDLVYLVRWVNGGDLSDTWSAQVGASAVYGPNATGPDGHTWIYGADWVAKWRPLVSDHGWPFVRIEGEVWLECVVYANGNVGDCNVTRSLDARFGLDEEAIKAARNWRFTPGTRRGEPVPVLVGIAMEFSIR